MAQKFHLFNRPGKWFKLQDKWTFWNLQDKWTFWNLQCIFFLFLPHQIICRTN